MEPGTWIIDTPGIRSFGLAHVPPETVVEAFVELAPGCSGLPEGVYSRGSGSRVAVVEAYVAAGHAGESGPARPGVAA